MSHAMKYDTERIRKENPLIEIVTKELGAPIKRGGWLFWPCPFHAEKTPSFGIHANKNPDTFHCFGCNKGGDIFTWARGYYNIPTFVEAAKYYRGQRDLSDAELSKAHAERARQFAAQAREEREKMEASIRRLQETQPWLAYRGNMDDYAVNLWWRNYGLDPKWQEFYMLGYSPNFYEGPSLTIPYFEPGSDYQSIYGLVHRIIGRDKDKFRPELANLPTRFYYANNKLKTLPPVLRVTEGQAKAMTMFAFLASREVQVIGTYRHLGTYPIEELDGVERILYYPDPGVPDDELRDKAEILGRDRTFFVRAPLDEKIDDALRTRKLSAQQLLGLERTAIRL